MQAHFHCILLIKALRKTLPALNGGHIALICDGKKDQKNCEHVFTSPHLLWESFLTTPYKKTPSSTPALEPSLSSYPALFSFTVHMSSLILRVIFARYSFIVPHPLECRLQPPEPFLTQSRPSVKVIEFRLIRSTWKEPLNKTWEIRKDPEKMSVGHCCYIIF